MNSFNDQPTPFRDTCLDSAGASSLAGLMAPVQCVLRPITRGKELRICGLDIERMLLLLSQTSREDATNMLIGFRTGEGYPPIEPPSLCTETDAWSSALVARIAWVVLLDGQVEARDAQAIQRAWERGGCLLKADLRTTSSMVIEDGNVMVLRSDDEELLLHAAGELLRAHVASRRNQPAAAIAPPEPGLTRILLGLSGTLTIRPIETESYSTWVDVGLNTCPDRTINPANCSVIYDTVGNSWHSDA